MDLTLNDSEIKEALCNYVNNQGFSTVGKSVEITLIAGRGPNGHKAEIAINTVTGIPAEAEVPSTLAAITNTDNVFVKATSPKIVPSKDKAIVTPDADNTSEKEEGPSEENSETVVAPAAKSLFQK